MIKVSLAIRTTKNTGDVRLRFRLTDGRKADLYHKSNINATIRELSKLTPDGSPKPKVVIYNQKLVESIKKEKEAMLKAYEEMIDRGLEINSNVFENEVDKILHPNRVHTDPNKVLLPRFRKFIEEGERDGMFGKSRGGQYMVVYRELERYLSIYNLNSIKTNNWTSDLLMDFRQFLFDEFRYVDKYPSIYDSLNTKERPKERRSSNTVASKLDRLKAFFSEMEDTGEIEKSPFRALGYKRRTAITRERYDEPVFLSIDELQKIMDTHVSERLEETKDAFLLQCALGCRVGDYQALSMDKLSIQDGIPYIHYLPRKTKKEQANNSEIETPLVKFALDIIKRYRFRFRILKNISGKDGYNIRIKELLKACGIDRKVKIFDEELGDNIYKPLYEVGSSKLSRKTHVDVTTKEQVNKYASGLHKEGSKAVERYTKLGIRERFILLSSAFKEPLYKVNETLDVLKWD